MITYLTSHYFMKVLFLMLMSGIGKGLILFMHIVNLPFQGADKSFLQRPSSLRNQLHANYYAIEGCCHSFASPPANFENLALTPMPLLFELVFRSLTCS